MPSITVYTTRTLMEGLCGKPAISMWSDHNEDGTPDPDVIDDQIIRASEEINLYCNQYAATGLSASPLIERWATVLACYWLSCTRGNSPPDGLARDAEYILKMLEKISGWQTTLPGVPLSQDFRPTMSNRVVNRRFRSSTIRITRDNSTDAPSVIRRNLQSDTLYDSS